MLSEIETIDWHALQHAYGSADDVPRNIKGLLARDEDLRSESMNELFGSVCHQGTVYSASAYVVPFLVELLNSPIVDDKEQIIILLASIAGGRGYYEVHEPILTKISALAFDRKKKQRDEAEVVRKVRLAASPYIPMMLTFLTHPECEVRRSVVESLKFYPEHYQISINALKLALQSEVDPEVIDLINEEINSIRKT